MQGDSTNVNRVPTPASWTAAEVYLAVVLAWLFWPPLVLAILKSVNVEHWYYPPDALEVEMRLKLWVDIFAAPLQVLTYPLIFAAFSGTRLDQLGLTMRRFGRNVLAGIVGLLLVAPPVFGILTLIRLLYGQGGEKSLEPHALETIAQQHLYPSEWMMLFFTAMMVAPLREELTFRGVLQPWLATRRWGGHAAMLLALAVTILFRRERLSAAWPEGIASLTEAAAPALFVLAMTPFYLLVWWRSRTPLPPAIFGVSLLFACIHTAVWPTPIPLFVLGLGLGVLAQRTRSLVAPIVLHGLFNGYSCVLLLLRP